MSGSGNHFRNETAAACCCPAGPPAGIRRVGVAEDWHIQERQFPPTERLVNSRRVRMDLCVSNRAIQRPVFAAAASGRERAHEADDPEQNPFPERRATGFHKRLQDIRDEPTALRHVLFGLRAHGDSVRDQSKLHATVDFLQLVGDDTRRVVEIRKATSETVILPAGIGRFSVRFIMLSKSFSST